MLYKPSTFFPETDVPVYMTEDDDDDDSFTGASHAPPFDPTSSNDINSSCNLSVSIVTIKLKLSFFY